MLSFHIMDVPFLTGKRMRPYSVPTSWEKVPNRIPELLEAVTPSRLPGSFCSGYCAQLSFKIALARTLAVVVRPKAPPVL